MTNPAKEYADAFFALACEKNAKYEYDKALDIICETFLKEPEYMAFLSAPSISVKERLDAIAQAFSAYVPEDALSFLQLMCKKGRISSLFETVAEYKALLFESEKIVRATIKTAVELTDDEKELLVKKLEISEKVNIKADYEIDETLLGGVIVTLGDKVLDGSLRGRLHELKDVMSQ